MKRLLFAISMLALTLIARDAQACFGCCVPPPYTRAECCSTICGTTGCLTTSSSTSSFCASQGQACSDNDVYCYSPDIHHPLTKWVSCEPRLADRWTLVAVKVTRPAFVFAARQG
jgi:hypothetical protein